MGNYWTFILKQWKFWQQLHWWWEWWRDNGWIPALIRNVDHPWFERGVCKKNTSDDVTLKWWAFLHFLDALASLDFKLSVTEWVTFLQLAHLRVFQIIFSLEIAVHWKCPKILLDIFFIANFSKCFFDNWFRWKTLWILW